MIEDLSGVAVDVEYASEYCYRSTHAAVDPIVMVITQSGETADTLAAQREALTRGVKDDCYLEHARHDDRARSKSGADHWSGARGFGSGDEEFYDAGYDSLS